MISYELPERKRINHLDEIFDGQNLLLTNFSNLDLSNINLSNIPMEKWEGCVFYNTNFKNTGIKFIPNRLGKVPCEEKEENYYFYPRYDTDVSMYYCDFSDNDLTYLKRTDFSSRDLTHLQTTNLDEIEYGEICTYGCNFSNTGINFLKTLRNLTLDTSYADYDFQHDYWKFESGTLNWPDFIDIHTIIKNKFLNVPSFRILNAISYYIKDLNYKCKLLKKNNFNLHGRIILSSLDEEQLKYVEKIINKCEEFLEYDKQGYGKKLYYKLVPFLTLEDKFEFFRFSIRNVHIKNLDFEDIPVEVLRYYEIINNKLENVTINYSIKDLFRLIDGHILDYVDGYENEYMPLYLPNINYSSWQENKYHRRNVSNSDISFFTKVYLELSRTCNANCPFCRNKSFDNCQYDIQKIKDTLYMIKNYINALVIGGGEPTLRLNDVKDLHESFSDNHFDWHMFSNGTNRNLINDDYIMDNFKLNISRHAVNDEENANIFKVDSNKIMSSKDIEQLNIRNQQVTLNAVCFNGGLDSFEKIISYIKFARDIGCKKVLIQDLQKETSLGSNVISGNSLCIDENIFFEVIEYLKANNYRGRYPIYATGGYVSYILKNNEGFSVALQRYINKDELEKEWIKAIKRAFDLSIAPNGNLYENWSQTTGLVRKLNFK